MLTKEAPQVWPLVRFLKHNRIELVVLNQDVHFHLPGVLAAKLCGLPCVCRKAGGIGEAQRIKRIVTPWVDLFVSISEATHKDQLETPGTRQLIMLHEGLDLKQFQRVPSKEVARRALGIPGGKTVVATISRIEKGKGQIEFLRMAAEVVRSERNVCFLVVGDEGADGGTLMAELAALASSLHLDDAVVFAGWRNDVPAVMAAVDIFVHCPTTFIEGLARTCLEAMAMKLPSIVSDNGGMSDAVIDGVTGFLIAPGDIGAMASAVLRLIRDDNLRRIQGIEARRRIEQMFNMPENAKRLQDVLVECAGQRRGAARSLEVTAVADAV
jgi:glycosyltransferase involved in cell wall biosynthesis